MICHGDTGVVRRRGAGPALFGDASAADAWKAIVLDGAMVKNGMVSFARYPEADDVETLRAYRDPARA